MRTARLFFDLDTTLERILFLLHLGERNGPPTFRKSDDFLQTRSTQWHEEFVRAWLALPRLPSPAKMATRRPLTFLHPCCTYYGPAALHRQGSRRHSTDEAHIFVLNLDLDDSHGVAALRGYGRSRRGATAVPQQGLLKLTNYPPGLPALRLPALPAVVPAVDALERDYRELVLGRR